MRRLLKQYAFQPAPYPNTTDFLKLLRQEAGPGHDAIIADLLEKITLLDVKITEASAVKRPDGRYDVTLQVEAHKQYADGQGRETEAPLDEPFEVGVFSAEPGKKDFRADSVLRFERLPVKTGVQTIQLVVDREPSFAGVDPYNKRIDRNSDDNLRRVSLR
jgi:aminopeptidase N